MPVLKPQHKVVRVADDDYIASGRLFAPTHYPLVEYVMQIDVGKQRRDHRPLGSPYLRLRPLPVFGYSGLQPLPDQPQYPWIRYSQLDQLHQLCMPDVVEKAFNTGIRNPVHLLHYDPRRERVERVVRSPYRPKTGREPRKGLLIDLLENRGYSLLDG